MDSVRALAHLLSAAAALLLLTIAPASAADTGSISGSVFAQSGEPVADVLVRLTGDRLPGARTTRTSINGAYRFDYVVPGDYLVELSVSPTETQRRLVHVDLGRETQADFVTGIAVTEQLTVTSTTAGVDVHSSEAGFNFSSDELASIPVERNYRGLFQLIPGVADNRSRVGPASGGGLQDNTYLLDGANITNPGFGYLSTEINGLDISEVNFKRAGVSADSGRTGGSIINVVSRSGTNRLTGIGRMEWLPTGLVSGYELPSELDSAGVRPGTFRDPLLTTEAGPAIGIGGPLVRDHAFFYGSAKYSQQEKWDRFNRVASPLPNEVRKTSEYYGKLTLVPFRQQEVNVSYRHRPSSVDQNQLDSTTAASVATTTDNGAGIASLTWAYFPGSRTSVNVQYLYFRENNEDVPVTDLGYLPPFNPGNLAAMGMYTDPTQGDLKTGGFQYDAVQNYRRHEVRATVARSLDLGSTGHLVKAGFGYESGREEYNRVANGWGQIVNQVSNGVPVLRARYFTPQPPQLGDGRTYSLFLQDDLTFGKRWSVNAGVLVNRDEFEEAVAGSGGCPATVLFRGGSALYRSHGDSCTFLQFGFGDEVQPRLGVTYQVRDGAQDKVYANWARYYNMDQKSSARSLAPNRVFQTQTIFDAATGAVVSSGPLASTTGKQIDPDLKPIYTDEWLVGYATPFGKRYSLDVFFMSRGMHNFIEDVPSRINGTAPDSGPFVATNLPCTRFASCQHANAERTYRALTVDVRRRLKDRWMADASYTWSRFEGNYDLDYSPVAVFNTSSFIQDGPGTNVEDPNRFGPLREDRPHVTKLFTSYAATGNLTFSGAFRVQSGAPWNARARDIPGAVMNYLEPAGSHRNPVWTNLDLMAVYRLPLSGRTRVSLEARVLNVLDTQTQLSTDSQQYLDLRTTSAPPYILPYQQPNPFFATGNAFAPPRRLYLSAIVAF